MKVKILANDGLENRAVENFDKAGIEVDTEKRDHDGLVRVIKDYDGLIVRSATKVTEDVLKAGKNKLKIVGRAGVGYDNIDVNAASENGIVVVNAPHGNTNAAAEHTLGLMLTVSRKISNADHYLKEGIWKKKAFEGTELSGKTLGIIGCGRIGQRLSELTKTIFMKVIGYDINPCKDSGIEFVNKLEDLLKQSDYVSIHVGGKDEIIGEKELFLMKPTAILINTARGSNVNQDALYNALKEGKIAGAGLDTYVNEPKKEGGKFDNKFKELDNIVLTSHLGASTIEAQAKTSDEMYDVMINYLKYGKFINSVNTKKYEEEKAPSFNLFITYEDIAGAFGKIATAISKYNINILSMSNERFKNTTKGNIVFRLDDKDRDLENNIEKTGLIDEIKSIKEVYYIKY